MVHTGDKINKKIHFCWLSGEPFNDIAERCIDTWRSVLPDYELVLWDSTKFDIESVPFVKQAYDAKKWAFASDYIRLFSVYNEGGIYLDTDVMVMKSFDDYLANDMFIPVEYHPAIANMRSARKKLDSSHRLININDYADGIGMQAAIFGARKGHPFIKDCMNFYESRDFVLDDGSFFTDPIAPGIYAKTAEKYGFRYKDEDQELDQGLTVVESKYFPSRIDLATNDAVAIHYCNGGWKKKQNVADKVIRRLRRAVF